jgi:hypothetical protein
MSVVTLWDQRGVEFYSRHVRYGDFYEVKRCLVSAENLWMFLDGRPGSDVVDVQVV